MFGRIRVGAVGGRRFQRLNRTKHDNGRCSDVAMLVDGLARFILCDLVSVRWPQYLSHSLQRSASLPASPPSNRTGLQRMSSLNAPSAPPPTPPGLYSPDQVTAAVLLDRHLAHHSPQTRPKRSLLAKMCPPKPLPTANWYKGKRGENTTFAEHPEILRPEVNCFLFALCKSAVGALSNVDLEAGAVFAEVYLVPRPSWLVSVGA